MLPPWVDPSENNLFDHETKNNTYHSDVWWACGLGIAFGLLMMLIYNNLTEDIAICCKGYMQ